MARPTAGVELIGGPQLARAFRRAKGRTKELQAPAERSAQIVADRARSLVPRLDGDLADSIQVAGWGPGASVTVGEGLEPYAGPIHFGWRAHNIEPNPFMDQALADSRDAIARLYDEEVGGIVRKFDSEAPDKR